MVNPTEMQEEILAQQLMSQNQNALNNFDEMRNNLIRNPSPESNYENAVFLLTNSDTFMSIPEIEKEIKLGNYDSTDKVIIQKLLNSYQDLILINDLQLQKYQQFLSKSDYKKFEQEQNLAKLDKLNFLRRAVSISSVSRGEGGFERKAQNTIISKSEINNDSLTQQKPNKVKSFFGGGRE